MFVRRIRNRQSRILISYIASLVAFILVPILLLTGIFLSNGLRQMESAYAVSQEYTLRQAIQNMDNDMKSFRQVAIQIATDPDVTPYVLNINNYDTILAIRKLAIYHAQVSFFDEMYLHINGDDNLYSGNGVISVNNFKNAGYRPQGEESRDDFDRYIAEGRPFALSVNGNGGYLVKKYDAKEYIAITYPWVDSGAHPLGSVVGLVESNYFTDILDISDKQYHENIYLFDEDVQLQFELENGPGFSLETIKLLMETYKKPGIHTGKVDGLSCFIIMGEAPTTGWKYIAVIPRSQFFLKYVRSENQVAAVITVLLVLCIVFGIVLAFRMYRPIRKLWSILEHVSPEQQNILEGLEPEMVKRGEWEHLHTSVTRIAEMNKTIARELEENKEMYSQSILKALLLGAVNAEHAQDTLAVQDIEFREPCSLVIILYCMSPTRASQAETAKALIEEQALPGLHVLMLPENNGCLTLLWNTDPEMPPLEEKITDLYSVITGKTELDWLFAVGSCCDNLNGISTSYLEALAVGDSMQEKGRSGIYHYGEFRKVQESNELYQDILAYVDAHYDDNDISLSGLAEKFSLSSSYLSRFFRKCSGMNFLEYVTKRRIKKACCLLRDTDLKIKDIVEQVGYFDVASFTKKFRNTMGVSPAKYREQVRQNTDSADKAEE